jgi:hypothetical protein
MSILSKVYRSTGLYKRLREHFLNTLLLPFATVGHIGIREARFLGDITRTLQSNRPIIEIGTLFGSSTCVIAQNKKDDQQLITVDSFSWNPCGLTNEQHRSITEALLTEAVNKCNVRISTMDKEEFYRTYNGPTPSMIFIDADHSYKATKSDIKWALSVGVDLICGHDYTKNIPGVVEAVDENGGIESLVDTLWVLRKNI